MGLGNYPSVGLADARTLALKCRRQVAKGADPIEARRMESKRIPVFTAGAARYIRGHRHGWQIAKHARQWVSTLKIYARPIIGKKPVNAITTEDILQILSPSWTTKTETAKRLQGQHIENVLHFAAAHQYRDPLNPAGWRGHLDKLHPRPSRVKQVAHHPAMTYPAVPDFFEELSRNGSVSARAPQFLNLTATRTLEVLHAEWREINQPAGVWTVPASRMKTRREHRVMLCHYVAASRMQDSSGSHKRT